MIAVDRHHGSAATFHALPLPAPVVLAVWGFEIARPALVLGSAQRDDVVDAAACAAAGVEVVRRRSGGGAVLLEPGGVVWFDVIVPADRLHADGVGDDVRASMRWLGAHVVRALGTLGVSGAAVHGDGMVCSAWSPLVCFAGLGPGEVVRDGVKLVGVSQRRMRAGSRFQCALHVRWSPGRLAPLLAAHPSVAELPPVAVLPSEVATGVPDAVADILAR